jgi:hypothetical protein
VIGSADFHHVSAWKTQFDNVAGAQLWKHKLSSRIVIKNLLKQRKIIFKEEGTACGSIYPQWSVDLHARMGFKDMTATATPKLTMTLSDG